MKKAVIEKHFMGFGILAELYTMAPDAVAGPKLRTGLQELLRDPGIKIGINDAYDEADDGYQGGDCRTIIGLILGMLFLERPHIAKAAGFSPAKAKAIKARGVKFKF